MPTQRRAKRPRGSTRSRARRMLPGVVLWLAALPAFGAAFEHRSGQAYRVPAGETVTGDRYVLSARTIAIEGVVDGDLVAWSRAIDVPGTVTGDSILAGESILIDGTAGDSLRVAANTLTINGTVDGDLLAFAASIVVGPNGRIKGDLIAFAQNVAVLGTVDGSIRLTGGEFNLTGSVAGSVHVTGEEVTLGSGARIGGDFSYEAREAIDVPAGAVGGHVTYEPARDEEEEEKSSSPVKSVLWWIWRTGSALVVGFLLLTIFRRSGPRVAAAVGRDTLGSLGIGFVTAVVVPVASILICLFIFTIPLAVLAFLIYAVLLYVAKLPVAVWLGQRLLRLTGAKAPGAGVGLLLGTPILYLLFEVPYLGTLLWFLALFVGLGAILVGARAPSGERPADNAAMGASPPLTAAT